MSEFDQILEEGKTVVKHKTGKLIRILVGLAAVGVLVFFLVCNYTYSTGTRSGTLIKVSHKGVVFKTFEGQLNMGGVNSSTDGLVGNIWGFSVTDKKLYEQLTELQGERVVLDYREIVKSMPWQAKTNYLITGVELVDE